MKALIHSRATQSTSRQHKIRLGYIGFAPITAVALLIVLFGQMNALPQAAPNAATIRYVTTDATPGASCTDSDPCLILEALGQSVNGDEIRVAEGVYNVNLNVTQTITMGGGFDSSDWSHNPLVHQTVLSGTNSAGTILKINNGSSPTIEGFIIQYGWSDFDGAGISNEDNGTDAGAPIIRNNIIRNNDGSAIRDEGSATIANNEIHGNVRGGSGAGIYVQNTIPDNTTILFNEIHDNEATGGNGDGAGIFVFGAGPSAFIEGNSIHENQSGARGGGIGHIAISSQITIQNNFIYLNSAANSGGGIYVEDNATIWHNTIVDNSAANGGGGIEINGGVTQISNTIVVSNTGTSPNGIRLITGTVSGDYNNILGNDLSGAIIFTNEITSNPDFVNYSTHNLHLSSSSLNIDEDGNLPEVTQDIDGEIRPFNGKWDIGADEYHPAVPNFALDPFFQQSYEPRSTTANYTLFLTNTGTIEDDYNIQCSIDDNANWAVSCTQTINNLSVDGSSNITVAVTVPNLTALTVANTHITVTSALSATIIHYAQIRTIIEPAPAVQFTPNYSETLQPGDTITFTHRITNTGDAIDTFDIAVTSNDPEWIVDILPAEPYSITLGSMASTDVEVQIKVPDYAASSYTNTTTIRASSRFDPATFAEVEDTITPEHTIGTRFVGNGGTDSNNNCTQNTFPCEKIEQALGQASQNDTIRIRGNNTFNESDLNTKDKVHLSGGWNSNFTEQIEDSFSIVDAQNGPRIFNIKPGVVSISNLILRNGNGGSQGGAVRVEDTAEPSFNNVIFENNSAGQGGAIYIGSGSAVHITKGQFYSNTATATGGGAIHNQSSLVTLNQSQFISNTTKTGVGGGYSMNGGQLYGANNLFAQGTAVSGAGLYVNGGTVSLEHQTFADNDATSAGGAIHNANATVNIVSSIIVSNTAPTGSGINNSGGTVTADFSNFYNNNISGTVTINDGFDVDPKFADEEYRLALGSPMIDAGSPGTTIGVDFEDDFRPTDQGYDVGYDEVIGCLASRDSIIYGSIQDAIDAPALTSDLILVSGICRGVNTIEFNGGTISQTVHITETVTIQGGWNSDFSQQTFEPTYIDPEGRGRAIFVTGNIDPVIETMIILNGDATGLMGGPNDEDAGGAIYNADGRPTFTAVSVFSSTAQIGGALYNHEGEAIYQPIFLEDNPLEVIRGQVMTNTATIGGAGFYAYSGTLSIDGVELINNNAPNGAGIYNESAVLSATNNIIANNTGTNNGAGFYNSSTMTTTILHNTFFNNAATSEGGGAYSNGGIATIMSNIFDSNQAATGPAIFANGGTVNADYNYYYDAATPVVGTGAGSNSITETVTAPGLTDPNNGDFHLLEDAPAVDNGDPNSPVSQDYEDDPRPSDQGPDMGADETVGCLVRINESNTPLYGSIQAAMEVASEGDIIDVAGICKGVHKFNTGIPSSDTDDCSTADGIIDVNLHINKNVILRGGWREDFSQQDDITVLDAEENGRVVYISENITATLDGFHIINGLVDNGAGICIDENAAPQILSNEIYSNTATQNGAGIYTFNSPAIIDKGNRIYENRATNGAGIATFADFDTTITSIFNNFIYNNTATNGGAIFNDGGNNLLWQNTLVGNEATAAGGAIFVNRYNPDIRGNLIVDNTASNTGGVFGLPAVTTPTVDYNDFYQNSINNVGGSVTDIGASSVISDPLFATNLYTITYDSPIVGISDPAITLAYDFEDDIRPSHQGVDMGADEVGGCFARNTADPSTILGSVQLAVDLASDGDLIEFDGECLGVNERNNGGDDVTQNLYISKSLTIDGNNWNYDGSTILTATLDARDAGRVIYIDNGATVTLTRMILQNGEAIGAGIDNHGGGIYNQGTLILDQVYLTENNANNGGAVYNANQLTINESYVGPFNTAVNGAGIYNDTGGQAEIGNKTLIFGNLADNGTAVYQNDGILMLDGNSIFDNGDATTVNGTIYLAGGSSIEVRNNFIYYNEAATGGGIYNDTTSNIWHNTLYGNEATTGNGGGIYSTNANANIDSNIVDNNTGTGIHAPNGTVARYNNVISFFAGEEYGGGVVFEAANSMSESPSYRIPNVDFHLVGGSAGEDVGNFALNVPNDIDDDIRPTNGGPDIGADEINTCLVRVNIPGTSDYNYYGVLQSAINYAESFPVETPLSDIEIARGECRGVVQDATSPPSNNTYQVGHVTKDLNFIGSLVRATFADQNDFGNPEIRNYTSILNAEGGGRVIRISDDASPTFSQLVFIGGDANEGGTTNPHGGAIYNNGSGTFGLNGGKICENKATNGAGYYGSSSSIADITGVRIGYCRAKQIIEEENGDIKSINSTRRFDGNEATNQGGGLWSNGRFDLRNVSFYENTAGSNGAGMFNGGPNNRIINGTFDSNESGSNGAGVYNTGLNLGLYHTTFIYNEVFTGTGAAIHTVADMTLNSSIVYSNTASTGAAFDTPSEANVAYNNFYDNYPANASPNGVGGERVGDPVIEQHPRLSGPYLTRYSPAIDQADPTLLPPFSGAPGTFPFGSEIVDYDRGLYIRPDGNPNHIATKGGDMGSDEYFKEFGCLIAFDPATDPYNVDERQVNQGETAVYHFNLFNSGHDPFDPFYTYGFTDTITLTLASSTQEGWSTLEGGNEQVFTLGWEEYTQGTLTVTVPLTASNSIQDITTLRCQSSARPDRIRTAQARTNVGLVSSLIVEPTHIDTAQPGDIITYTHTVENAGNSTVKALITPNAGPQHASADLVDADGVVLTDTIVTLEQDEIITVFLRVTILDTAEIGDVANPGVVATEVDDNDVPIDPLNQGSVINEITILPAPGTRHVATTGSADTTNCTNPAQPCATIQHAIDQAVDNDDILISTGTYSDTVTQTIGIDTYTQNIYIDKSVNLRGGYNVNDNFATYAPITNTTYIDGLENNRTIFITNSHTVTISSLFIQNGLADGSDPAGSVGGAIYNAGSDLTITGTWVLSNTAQFAAGLYHEAGELIVNSSVFAGNSNDAAPTDLGEGAAIYVVTGTAHIENNTFHGNVANESGISRPGPTAVLLDAPVDNDGYGGAIYVEGGTLKALNNIFSENQGEDGSAIYIKAGVTITNDYNIFWTAFPSPVNFLSSNIVTGTNSVITDPLYIDAYYHIDSLSPAKDTGTNAGLTILDVDFELDSRPQGIAVDIGADERVQRPGFEFSPTPLSSTINTGEVVTYTHWLTTTGDVADTYTMTLQHQTIGTGFSYTLSPTMISGLATGQSVKVTLVVTGGIPGGYDQTTITATSATDLSRIVTDTTIISQTAGVDIETSEFGLGLPAQTISYAHTLTNTGDGIDQFDLSILSETPSGWNVTLTPTQTGFLLSGETIPFTVTVDVPAGTLSDTVHVVEIIANAYDPDASDILTDTTTVAASYGLSLTPDNSSTVNDGVTAVYTHTLENTGNQTDTINLNFLSTPNWTVEVEPASVMLQPLETQEIVVSVTVPVDTGGVVHTALITATSQGGLTATAVNTTTVDEIRSLMFTPANSVIQGDAGEIVTHTHTLTNTGNITDTYFITPTSSLNWLTDYTMGPIELGPKMSATITTSVTITPTALPPDEDRTVITATSQTDSGISAMVEDLTSVSIIYGLDFTPDNSGTAPSGSIVTYTHYLTNTGNADDTFGISGSSSTNPLWTVVVVPNSITLQRDESTPVVVSITIPLGAGGTTDITTLLATSLNPSYNATVTDTTTITGPSGTLSVTIAPDNASLGLPGNTIEYQHTVTNAGTLTATFSITAVSDNGWNLTIPTDNILLNPQESQGISITVDIPAGTLSNTVDTITVTAYVDADPSKLDTATDVTTVGQDSGVIIEPDNAQNADENTTITYQHTITNSGNGSDTFTLSAATTINGWPVQVPPPVTIGSGLTSTVLVTLTVPMGTQGLVEPMVVTATSAFDPSLFDTAVNTTTVNGAIPTRNVIVAPDLNGSGDPGDTVEYTHTITNLGDVTEQFAISIVPSDPSWVVTYFPSNITLTSLQTDTITVRVTIPMTATAGQTMQTTVTALSLAGTTDSAINTTTVNSGQQEVYLPVILNSYSAPIDPTPTPTPTSTVPPTPCSPTNVDLIVTGIQVQPTNPTSGEQATVLVTIRNQGTSNVAFGNNFYLDFYVNRVPGYALSGDVSWGIQGTTMSAGASQTFSAPYTFTGGTHQLYAQVDTDNTVDECPNEDNNITGPISLTVSGARANDDNNIQTVPEINTEPRNTPTPEAPIAGDVNGDGETTATATATVTGTPIPVYTPTVTSTPEP